MKRLVLILLGLSIIGFPAAYGQCEKAKIDSASIGKPSGRVSIGFSLPFASPTPTGIGWTVLDATSQALVSIVPDSIKYYSADQYSTPTSATFQLATPVDDKHSYLVTATNAIFEGCPPGKPATVFAQLAVAQDSAKKKPSGPFTITATKGRDDSDLYLAGLLQGADGTKASYTADIKLQIQVPIKSAATGRDNKFRAGWWFVPSYDFKASTAPKSDGNSVTATAAVAHGFRLPGSFFTWDEVLPGFVVESDKQYKAINTLASLRSDVLVRTFGSGNLQLDLQPFFLLVAGENARTPLAAAYPGGVVRPGAGIHTYLNLFKSSKPGRRAFVENEYIRRLPLLAEPVFSQDKSGNLNLVSVGTNPRDYVWTKFEFDFTDYFGLTLGHDFGELPPVYTKVSNKYSIGLVIKTGLKYKPK